MSRLSESMIFYFIIIYMTQIPQMKESIEVCDTVFESTLRVRGQDPENLTKHSITSITVTQLTLRHKKVPKHY